MDLIPKPNKPSRSTTTPEVFRSRGIFISGKGPNLNFLLNKWVIISLATVFVSLAAFGAFLVFDFYTVKHITDLKNQIDAIESQQDAALVEKVMEIEKVSGAHEQHLARRDYRQALQSLAALRSPVDAFFEAVLVMADTPAVRDNRLAQLRRLRDLFLGVADLSCLPTPAR